MIWKRFAHRTAAIYDTLVSLDNKYELVIGPVANDDLALLFRQFSGGLITVEELTEEMKFK